MPPTLAVAGVGGCAFFLLHNRFLLRYFKMVCRVPVFPPARVFNTTTFSLSAFVGSVARMLGGGCSKGSLGFMLLCFRANLAGPVLFVYAFVSLDLVLFLCVW
ncbi:hypothetical protein DVH24_041262 [Malus domestica]|uniref:Uncharacterized protein n=1 Tax=Malus domestica TaxID=3750 RepID=A0A498IDG7_MALDO|nr:hypothetical protein DVH24_041262 [Malus domestica]